jgi:hypothetical protein
MSNVFGSDVTPESTLRFSVEKLYAAGATLGIIESSMSQPKATFEELERRAEDLLHRMDDRKIRRITSIRILSLAVSVCGVAVFLRSFVGRNE